MTHSTNYIDYSPNFVSVAKVFLQYFVFSANLWALIVEFSYISSHASFILILNPRPRFLSRSSIFSKLLSFRLPTCWCCSKSCLFLFQFVPFHFQRSSLTLFWIFLRYLSSFPFMFSHDLSVCIWDSFISSYVVSLKCSIFVIVTDWLKLILIYISYKSFWICTGRQSI